MLRDIVAHWQENESEAAVAQMRIGRYLVDRGDPGAAEAELRLVITQYPTEQTAVWQAKIAMIDALLALKRLEEAAGLADALWVEAAESDEFRTWAQVKQAELLMAQGRCGSAAERFLSLAGQETGAASGEAVNWARVQLMNIYAGQWRSSQVEELCQTVLDEHALGKATDRQAAWALVWKGYSLQRSGRYDDAIRALEMAAALAEPAYPYIMYRARFFLGEAYRLSNRHVKALEQYQRSLDAATSGSLADSDQDWARLQVGSELRHLGMLDKGVATLRVGISDPSALTKTDALLVERITSFLKPVAAEAWLAYVSDPTARVDPTLDAVMNWVQSLRRLRIRLSIGLSIAGSGLGNSLSRRNGSTLPKSPTEMR